VVAAAAPVYAFLAGEVERLEGLLRARLAG
jgi:hypothetical protein